MALTRKLLKGMGLTEEQVDTIIEAHTDTVDALKADAAKYKTDAEKVPGLEKKIKELETDDGEDYKAKYEQEKKDHAQTKANYAAKETHAAKEKAYRELLISAGVSEKRIDTILRVSDLEKVELEDGKIKGADELTKTIKTEWADFIVTTQTKGADVHNPPANNDGNPLTKADIYKKDEHGRYVMSTAERQKALAENPNLIN